MPTQQEVICQVTLDDATPCRNPVMAGSAYCWVHREQAEIEIDFGSEAGWLAIDDRSAPDRSTLAKTLGQPRIEGVGNGDGVLDDQPQPADDATGDDLLVVDDRLTQRKHRDAERRSRLQEEFARFGQAAQRLAPPGAEAVLPSVDEVRRLMQQVLGPLSPRLETLWQSG